MVGAQTPLFISPRQAPNALPELIHWFSLSLYRPALRRGKQKSETIHGSYPGAGAGRWFVALAALLFVQTVCAQMYQVTISADTVFTARVEIPVGSVCTIKPGVRIAFAGSCAFVVRGLLIAEGTASQPILFTGEDRSRGSAERPCWQGLEISGPAAHASLRHCRIEGAFRNLIQNARPVIDSCEFVGNHYALYCQDKSVPHVSNCRVYRNKYGVVADDAAPLLLGNTITANSVGVLLQAGSSMIAGRNSISDNTVDVRSEDCLGPNQNALAPKNFWDLMQRLY
jgi:hypothetical protein